VSGFLSIGRGYDPRYLYNQVGRGAENYYLSAVREHGEPPGYWSGKGAEALGLDPGTVVDPATMKALYGEFLDPRDPRFLDKGVPVEEKARLGGRMRKYASSEDILARKLAEEPEATEERREELRIQAGKEARSALKFLDLTYSAHKSVSLTHAGLLALAQRAEEAGDTGRAQAARAAATEVEEAIKEAAAAGVEAARGVASFARVGYHGKQIDGVSTGKWMAAGDWVVASFLQHDSRDNDPNLHVHQAVLNRQLCQDGKWRSLDSRAVFRARAQAGAIAERTMMERLTRTLGIEWAPTANGQSFQVVGVTPEQIAAFSTRRVEIVGRVAELVATYEAVHGRAPSARTMFLLSQQATKDTKKPKDKPRGTRVPTRAEELAAWEERATRAEIDSLTSIPEKALFRVGDEQRDRAAAAAAEVDLDRVIAAAIADAQSHKSVFSPYELTRHISRHLPPSLGGLSAEQTRRLLLGIRDEAMAPEAGRVLRLTVGDVVDIPRSLQREDGSSVFRDPSGERLTTPDELDAEQRFLVMAAQGGAVALDAEELAQLLRYAPAAERVTTVDREPTTADGPRSGADEERSGADAGAAAPAAGESGADAAASGADRDRDAADRIGDRADRSPSGADFAYGLMADQVAAVYGIATSGRQVDVLEGYAGAGKSYTVSRLAEVWRERTGQRVIGLTTAQNAANVLRDEGLDDAWNLARWLRSVEQGRQRLQEGQLVVVDEASMVTNDVLVQVADLAREAGAKLLLTGDSEQLSAPGAGGLMRLLAREQGSHVLTTVRRFVEPWEREASVRLREGDADVLAEYDQHGRIRGGTREEMEAGARTAYLADYLAGKQSLLLAATNEQAIQLSAQVRDRLVAYGVVDDTATARLRDGNRVGVGDLIAARENDRTVRIGGSKRRLTNRDVLAVDGLVNGEIIARLVGPDGRPGAEVTLKSDYVTRHVELAYAGTVHAAQGRTVDTCHALVEDGMARQMAYVEMTRGREGNWAWVVTEEQGADLRSGPQARAEADQAASGADRGAARSGAELPEAEPLPLEMDPAGVPAGPAESGADRDRSGADREASAPERDALGVLAAVLETDQADRTATEVAAIEADRVHHLAHLGSMWTSVVKDAVADRTSQLLERLLPAEVHERLAEDPARGAVMTAARRAVLAGHDLSTVLTTATADGWERARSIGQVLSARIQRSIGTGEAAAEHTTWTDRTPRLGDAEMDRFASDLARAMDERTRELGERAAAESPAWLVERLGEVPNEIMARTEWTQRAGLVYAYREQYGNTEATQDVLGAAPDRHSPEQRAAWLAASAALGRSEDERTITEARDGQLWSWRAAYEREAVWAPPHVGEDLRAARTERDDRAREAVLLDIQAGRAAAADERGWLAARADAARALAEAARERIGHLEVVDKARRGWHAATQAARDLAMRADAELHRRHTGLDLPPLHGEPAEGDAGRRAPEPAEVPEGQTALFPAPEREVAGQQVLFGGQTDRDRQAGRGAEPEREPAEAGREPAAAQREELDLGLAPAGAPEGDVRLRRALEQATQARQILAARAERQERERADEEPEAEERRQREARAERYQDALSRREQAELDRRAQLAQEREEYRQAVARAARSRQAPGREGPGIEM
jgi:conjugative relaxase-like TrwC/TraI family protein